MICDFGLARRVRFESNGVISATLSVMTRHFAAPEQHEWGADRKSIDLTAAADVYAFGGLIYFLITGGVFILVRYR